MRFPQIENGGGGVWWTGEEWGEMFRRVKRVHQHHDVKTWG